ncbi:hypothetical protein SAMN00777080_0069 [Aquiflexum balticum DSM 16537]|uniref:Uncharacterized protein n=1 Tax=Aquiflexum balticum DSM 16537 TaxID=758820 RepID=A0A1W2GXX2_9BACT|nr:hypothetical protein SAMN00777080_0069 [Aquiflexum balticum DSM 16537]
MHHFLFGLRILGSIVSKAYPCLFDPDDYRGKNLFTREVQTSPVFHAKGEDHFELFIPFIKTIGLYSYKSFCVKSC